MNHDKFRDQFIAIAGGLAIGAGWGWPTALILGSATGILWWFLIRRKERNSGTI